VGVVEEVAVAMGVMERRQQTARRTFGEDRKEKLEKAIGWGSWLRARAPFFHEQPRER